MVLEEMCIDNQQTIADYRKKALLSRILGKRNDFIVIVKNEE